MDCIRAPSLPASARTGQSARLRRARAKARAPFDVVGEQQLHHSFSDEDFVRGKEEDIIFALMCQVVSVHW